jgi:hypothetical protein
MMSSAIIWVASENWMDLLPKVRLRGVADPAFSADRLGFLSRHAASRSRGTDDSSLFI